MVSRIVEHTDPLKFQEHLLQVLEEASKHSPPQIYYSTISPGHAMGSKIYTALVIWRK